VVAVSPSGALATALLLDRASNFAHVSLHPPPPSAQFVGAAPDPPPAGTRVGRSKHPRVERVSVDDLALANGDEEMHEGSGRGLEAATEGAERVAVLVASSVLPLLARLLTLGYQRPTSNALADPGATAGMRWEATGLFHAHMTSRCLEVAGAGVGPTAWRSAARDQPQLLQGLLSLATEVTSAADTIP
jgi:hypothetical protein